MNQKYMIYMYLLKARTFIAPAAGDRILQRDGTELPDRL